MIEDFERLRVAWSDLKDALYTVVVVDHPLVSFGFLVALWAICVFVD